MGTSLQLDALEFHTDRVERLVIGAVLVFAGGGALAFWNVERGTQWPLVAIVPIGMFIAGLGIFLLGFRWVVRLDPERGASELRTLFGVVVARRNYPMAGFEAVGCHGSTTEMLYLDVVLFKPGGGFLTLRTMLADAEARNEIVRVAQYLGLPAEFEPRTRLYWIGGLE